MKRLLTYDITSGVRRGYSRVGRNMMTGVRQDLLSPKCIRGGKGKKKGPSISSFHTLKPKLGRRGHWIKVIESRLVDCENCKAIVCDLWLIQFSKVIVLDTAKMCFECFVQSSYCLIIIEETFSDILRWSNCCHIFPSTDWGLLIETIVLPYVETPNNVNVIGHCLVSGKLE